jgi:hypothetical protein
LGVIWSKCCSLFVYLYYIVFGSRAVDGKRFLESNASSIPGTYFKLRVPRIEEAFDSRNLLPSTDAVDPCILFKVKNLGNQNYRKNKEL